MSALAQDLRYALRSFSSTPGLAVTAILSIALRIGANKSMFSVVNALPLHQLRYQDADRLGWRSCGIALPV